MSIWNQTKDDIVDQVINLHRKISHQTQVSKLEKDIINSSINTSFMQLCTDFGVERWKFLDRKVTCTLESGADSFDVFGNTDGSSVFDYLNNTMNVYDGTKEYFVSMTDMAQLETLRTTVLSDGSSNTGRPVAASADWSAGPLALGFQVFPNADAEYSISLWVKILIDSEDMNLFPPHLRPALRDKCIGTSLRDLGHLNESMRFDQDYEKSLVRFNQSITRHVPSHVPRVGSVQISGNGVQARAGG